MKTLEATNTDPWGPHGTAMYEIASACINHEGFGQVFAILRKRLALQAENWRQVYKALLVIEYMIKHCPRFVVEHIKDENTVLRRLRYFEYKGPDGRDHGINVRTRAETLIKLLQDGDALNDERQKAKTATRKLAQGLLEGGAGLLQEFPDCLQGRGQAVRRGLFLLWQHQRRGPFQRPGGPRQGQHPLERQPSQRSEGQNDALADQGQLKDLRHLLELRRAQNDSAAAPRGGSASARSGRGRGGLGRLLDPECGWIGLDATSARGQRQRGLVGRSGHRGSPCGAGAGAAHDLGLLLGIRRLWGRREPGRVHRLQRGGPCRCGGSLCEEQERCGGRIQQRPSTGTFPAPAQHVCPTAPGAPGWERFWRHDDAAAAAAAAGAANHDGAAWNDADADGPAGYDAPNDDARSDAPYHGATNASADGADAADDDAAATADVRAPASPGRLQQRDDGSPSGGA